MAKHTDNPKEIILSAAKDIALKDSINKINIRLVAQKSNMAIGSVYNYFPTKADLLVAVIEDFWTEAFQTIDFKALAHKEFYDKIEEIYYSLYDYLNKFKENWLEQISLLSTQEKKLGRKREAEYFTKMHNMIIALMDKDETISKHTWKDGISKEKTAEFIFNNMLLMLKKGEKDFQFFINVLKKIMAD